MYLSDPGGKVVASRRQNRARQLENTLAGRILCLYRCHSSQVGRNDRRGDRIPRSHPEKSDSTSPQAHAGPLNTSS